MLYEQIRYAEEVRKIYRLRHLLLHHSHPAIDSLIGYQKGSTQFYRIKKTLQTEKVLDNRSKFIENPPNLWMAELALHASKAQTKLLGHRVPYSIFLSVVLQPTKELMIRELPRDLLSNRQIIHHALKELSDLQILRKDESRVTLSADEKVKKWLVRYIEIAKSYADATGDIFYLFNAIPAHIGGLAAKYATSYEPGRPIGPTSMTIETYKPFYNLWESFVNDVAYFKDYPKKVEVGLAQPNEEIEMISGIPYHRGSHS